MVRTHTLLSLAFLGLQACQSPRTSSSPPAREPAAATATAGSRAGGLEDVRGLWQA